MVVRESTTEPGETGAFGGVIDMQLRCLFFTRSPRDVKVSREDEGEYDD